MEREREAAVGKLKEAFADEQIDVEELERRLDRVEAATTPEALVAITSDLAMVPSSVDADDGPTVRVFAIMGGAERKGAFDVPPSMSVTAFWGGAEIDLREARFAGRHELSCVAIMGGIGVLVPGHVRVRCSGIGVMGGFSDETRSTDDPGAPELVVTGIAFWGGVEVRTKGSHARKRLPRG